MKSKGNDSCCCYWYYYVKLVASYVLLIKRHFSWLTSSAFLCDSSVLALTQNKRELNTSPGLSLQQAELGLYFWALFLSNTQGCITNLFYSNFMLHCIGSIENYNIVELSKCSLLVQALFLDQQSMSAPGVSILWCGTPVE